ncbi:unnamed protein product, partial [Closterium sp. NIES-64]
GAAAAASKVLGLMREMVLAAAFGVGPVMTAFSYASLIPTFCLSLLGAAEKDTGKDSEKDTGKDSEKGGARSSLNAARMQQELLVLVSVLVALASIVAALLILLCARPIIDLLAPGLSFPPAAVASDPSAVASFALTRHVAISQLQQMAPTIALAPLIGIGFGTLSARGEFAIPSLSPSLSSLSVLLGIAVYFALCRWSPVASPQREIIGGTCLAVSFTAGALLQWLIQLVAEIRSAPAPQQLAATPLPETTAAASAVQVVQLREVFGVLIPATVASGMLQIATFTDLYFASFLPGTAAALGYLYFASFLPGTAAALGSFATVLLVLLPVVAPFESTQKSTCAAAWCCPFPTSQPTPSPPPNLPLPHLPTYPFFLLFPPRRQSAGHGNPRNYLHRPPRAFVVLPSLILIPPSPLTCPPLSPHPSPDANLLVMAPLGILSTALLVPLLPAFARLAHPKDRPLLKDSLRRGLVMALAVTLPMTAVMLPLARPIVRIVFQRRSFDASATSLVSSLLSCYLLGSPCYLARDVLVRLFYSLADGTTPFLISTFAIAANAVLDFLFVSRWKFGPQGLVLATAAVNSASAVALLCLAHRRMGGLPLSLWWPSFSILFQSAAATAITVTVMHKLLSAALTTASHLLSLQPTWVWLLDAAALGTTAAAGFLVFCALVVTMRLPEAMPLWARVKSLLQKHGLLKLRTSAQF